MNSKLQIEINYKTRTIYIHFFKNKIKTMNNKKNKYEITLVKDEIYVLKFLLIFL